MKKVFLITISLWVATLYANTPVMLDGEGDDPCSLATIKGLDPKGDGFLAVRSDPNGNAKLEDKLYNGDKVWYCDEKGKWAGIVYGKDCDVSAPANPPKPYKGSCKSGWVFGKWVSVLAG